jgi:flagellar basal body-associated protein FliL
METPDILNSKIKKIRIELPHYSFSHSAAGDSLHAFIGRDRIREKLKKVLEDSPDEPGIYLIAGNRGVGKTSLVSEVIKDTSLQTKTNFSESLKYLLLLLFFVAGTQFCLQKFNIPEDYCLMHRIVSFLIFSFFFILLCCFNSYRRKIPEQPHGILMKIWNFIKSVFNSIMSAVKELSYLINPHNPYGKSQYLLKIILVVGFTQIASIIFCVIPIMAFLIYLIIVICIMLFRFGKRKSHEYKQKHKKGKIQKDNILFLLKNLFLIPIWNYIKNRNRLYLRINFGHKLKDEKDILRLIARTLSTEYNKYRRLVRRTLPWRAIALGILLLFTYLFSPIVENQEFYKSLIKDKELYKASSQILLDDIHLLTGSIYVAKANDSTYFVKENNSFYFLKTNDSISCLNVKLKAKMKKHILLKKDSERLDGVFSKTSTLVVTKVEVEGKKNSADEMLSKRIKLESKIGTKASKVGHFLLVLDQLVYEITKIVKKIPKYFWEGKTDFSKEFVPPINYLRWLLFFLMYLFCVLLFRCNWITHFFVTHRIITRRLRKLNSDITHSTERENSISVNTGNTGPEIGTKTKRSRNVADAREIEKKLQDILDDMQRIPVIMCRPKIVIVFDELDKVEPSDASLEKENLQTKASLFSINATRERQTEILKILSNMKYFLSSAKAKFIFIAGREMLDIHLADVSERNNYIGSIFNVVISVPSFLTDHHKGKESIPQESSIASLPEEFVCRRLIPHDYLVESYDLENYRKYLRKEIFKDIKDKVQKKEKIQKIISVLQQFIIYLAHVSKGAPKKMMQLFESFIEIHIESDKNNKNTLFVQRYHSSRHFLSFNYYKQYTLGIIAYLITPIFYRLAESNIKEHSDKLLVSALRFVDFVFKFHKHSFSWKHLDMSPEMLEANRAPELKSVAVDLLNYLTQVHINKSNFNLSDYKFDGLIANEIFAMTKTDEVFSALFSFSLDETLPLKKHYQDLLGNAKKENKSKSYEFIDAISSLQSVLGDLHYYDDELEEAEVYYKSSIQAYGKNKNDGEKTFEQFYVYVRNMLRLGIIYEKRKQYDFAYLTYGELCKRIIRERTIAVSRWNYKNASLSAYASTYDISFEKMIYDGLKMLYLPFIARLQILEQSHIGGITHNHLEQLDKDFEFLTKNINHEEAKLLEAEFYSRVADVLYYKNSDLRCKKDENRKENKNTTSDNKENTKNYSCTACYYYHKALSILLGKNIPENTDENTVKNLLCTSIEKIKDNYNMKFCTILARILSDWGNVFFSCDTKDTKDDCKCYICDAIDCNTRQICCHCACYICDRNDCDTNNSNNLGVLLKRYVNDENKEKNRNAILNNFFTKSEIAFAMYAISSVAYRKVNLYKRSSYQIYKMLCLFKDYEIYKNEKSKNCIKALSKKAIHYLWYANDDLNVLELNKRKEDFNKNTIKEKILLKNLLVDSEITRIRILVKEMELKSDLTPEKLKKYYGLYITSPYKINYSIVGRIYRLWLKSKVNYKAYQQLLEKSGISKDRLDKKDFVLKNDDYSKFKDEDCNETVKIIFGKYFNIEKVEDVTVGKKIKILENLIAETIYCLTDIAQLTETMDETYLLPHSFLGSIHEHLSFWIRQYEAYEVYKKEIDFYKEYGCKSRIDEYLKQYLDEEWREQLSGYRENQRALSHYYRCLEMHNEGRAYHNMIDLMCYVKDDFNDRSDHFNIAEERHLISNKDIERKIKDIKDIYKDSKLYKVENYFG